MQVHGIHGMLALAGFLTADGTTRVAARGSCCPSAMSWLLHSEKAVSMVEAAVVADVAALPGAAHAAAPSPTSPACSQLCGAPQDPVMQLSFLG